MESVEALINSAIVFSHLMPLKGNRIAILTNAGGPGILAVDTAIRKKLTIQEPPGFSEVFNPLCSSFLRFPPESNRYH